MTDFIDCVCGHGYGWHSETTTRCCLASAEGKPLCGCKSYDPNGHNPELINFICPQCKKLRMELSKDRIYHCIYCQYIMSERQVKEMFRRYDNKKEI